MNLIDEIAERLDKRLEHHLVLFLNRLETLIMNSQDAVVAALQDLQTTMTTTLTDLEAKIAAIPTSGDTQPALDLIASMKASLTAADATTKTAAPAPAEPPAPVDTPAAPPAVDPAAPAATDPAV